MIFSKKGTFPEGIKYEQIEETVIYTLENEDEFEKIVKKLNSQLGFNWYKVYDTSYPHLFVIDTEEMHYRQNMVKNKYHAINNKEYDICYISDVKEHIVSLISWVENHSKANLSDCKKYFEKYGMFNIMDNKNSFQFDFNYGPFVSTISKANEQLELCSTLELHDDDFCAGSGEFSVSSNAISEIEIFWKSIYGDKANAYLVA